MLTFTTKLDLTASGETEQGGFHVPAKLNGNHQYTISPQCYRSC